MTDQTRDAWGSQLGFILAATGSAVGLGHIWRFPYVAGENGGAAFVLLYIGSVFLIGLPILLVELTLGRHSHRDPVGAIKAIAGQSGWKYLGYLGVASGVFILSFYTVVAGWTFGYLFKTLIGDLTPFGAFSNNALLNGGLYLAFLLMTVGVVYGGISGGIEKWSKILMPILPVILIAIIIYGLTLDGAGAGVSFYLKPDFSRISTDTVLVALGQAFFANSLGMGAMVTYGSYLKDSDNIPGSGLSVVLFGLLISFLAGFAIFPAVFAMGASPAEGPQLVFVVLPQIFASMPGGVLVGFAFFLILTIAALTSTISMMEVPVAFLIDEKKMVRKTAVWVVAGVTVLFGIPSALSFGGSAFFTDLPFLPEAWSVDSFFDIMDYIFGNVALPVGGFFFAVFLGWRWGIDEAIAEIAKGNQSFLGIKSKVWGVLVKYVCPIIIVIVLLNAMGIISF